jgi:hypothetical protein
MDINYQSQSILFEYHLYCLCLSFRKGKFTWILLRAPIVNHQTSKLYIKIPIQIDSNFDLKLTSRASRISILSKLDISVK